MMTKSRGLRERHGQYGTPVYRSWHNMLSRCRNPNSTDFKNYGGRGITVCDRWLRFPNFYADMGDPPPGMLLERERNDQGYEPGNCIWATRLAQNRNRRSSKLTLSQARTINSSSESYSVLAKRYGVTKQAVYAIKKKKAWRDA